MEMEVNKDNSLQDKQQADATDERLRQLPCYNVAKDVMDSMLQQIDTFSYYQQKIKGYEESEHIDVGIYNPKNIRLLSDVDWLLYGLLDQIDADILARQQWEQYYQQLEEYNRMTQQHQYMYGYNATPVVPVQPPAPQASAPGVSFSYTADTANYYKQWHNQYLSHMQHLQPPTTSAAPTYNRVERNAVAMSHATNTATLQRRPTKVGLWDTTKPAAKSSPAQHTTIPVSTTIIEPPAPSTVNVSDEAKQLRRKASRFDKTPAPSKTAAMLSSLKKQQNLGVLRKSEGGSTLIDSVRAAVTSPDKGARHSNVGNGRTVEMYPDYDPSDPTRHDKVTRTVAGEGHTPSGSESPAYADNDHPADQYPDDFDRQKQQQSLYRPPQSEQAMSRRALHQKVEAHVLIRHLPAGIKANDVELSVDKFGAVKDVVILQGEQDGSCCIAYVWFEKVRPNVRILFDNGMSYEDRRYPCQRIDANPLEDKSAAAMLAAAIDENNIYCEYDEAVSHKRSKSARKDKHKRKHKKSKHHYDEEGEDEASEGIRSFKRSRHRSSSSSASASPMVSRDNREDGNLGGRNRRYAMDPDEQMWADPRYENDDNRWASHPAPFYGGGDFNRRGGGGMMRAGFSRGQPYHHKSPHGGRGDGSGAYFRGRRPRMYRW